MASTVSIPQYWVISIYFFLFPQIGMSLTEYAMPGRCNPGTPNILDTSVGNRLTWVVSMSTFFQVYHRDSSL